MFRDWKPASFATFIESCRLQGIVYPQDLHYLVYDAVENYPTIQPMMKIITAASIAGRNCTTVYQRSVNELWSTPAD